MTVVWHDLECGSYAQDLPVWRELVARHGEPVLDVGAGAGRVALDLARMGHRVIALDRDAELLGELRRRAGGLPITTVQADARDFALAEPVTSCIVPMQTIQLLRGSEERRAFFGCARRAVRRGGVLALAITPTVDVFDGSSGEPLPLPDVCEVDGVVYQSLPTAVRIDGSAFVLERRRETVGVDGAHSSELDVIRLERVTSEQLRGEAEAAGFRLSRVRRIAATSEHVGGEVVVFDG